jgi:3-dehydroquinate dehydratase/shikimate dehydrogenase
LALQCDYGSLNEIKKYPCDVLIQATSVGMAPHLNETPISSHDLNSNTLVFDVIWNPMETRLLKEAHLKGCKVCPGIELFIHQAVRQFSYWLGAPVDIKLIEDTIRQTILLNQTSRKEVSIQRSRVQGTISIPSSKSHSIRAILLGSLAHGKSIVRNPLFSPDVNYAIRAARQLGAVILEQEGYLEIEGLAGQPQTPDNVIEAGNSGQVLRFVGAFAALNKGYTVITGDHSIRFNRPVTPLLNGIKGLGGFAESTRQNGQAPIIIKGPIYPGRTILSGEDSQPVSALLMASAFLDGETEIHVLNPGEKPWIQLTLSWLDRLGVDYENHEFERFIVRGKRECSPFDFNIPGDFSSAIFPITAALLTKSNLVIENIEMDDVQGDKAIIFLLQQMGANIEIDSSSKRLFVKTGGTLVGRVIDINDFIDGIPILAVIGCFAEGETVIINGSIARRKECDRIACISSELKKMGADIIETQDGLQIRKSILKGASVNSHHDHRMALSLIVAGLAAHGETIVEEVDCIEKSYPSFIADMQKLGASIRTS